MAVSPNGQKIAAAGIAPPGSLDAPVKVWDARSRRVGFEFPDHSNVVFDVAWDRDGRRIASVGWDRRHKQPVVKIWDAQTGRQAFPLPPGGAPHHVAFSLDGLHLITGGLNRTVEVWDAQTGHKVGTLGAHDREIRGLAFGPDGRLLASASVDGAVKLWDWDATRLREKQVPRRTIRARATQVFLRVAFSPDSRRLVAGAEKNTVKIWDVQTGVELQTLEGHSGEVWVAAFSPDLDGRWVASAGEDSTVKLWDSHTGTLIRSIRGHTGVVGCLAFIPNSRLLVSGSRDGTVKVWDLTSLGKKPE
jgi:WD40 repeat protein